MGTIRFDVLIVGSGPAGSAAALVLARAGARVALVDKASFPRDKACGDLVGPRGVQLLSDLGLDTAGPRVGDMLVVGPTGRRVRLPARPGRTYPGYGIVAPRCTFDAMLQKAALDAGVHLFVARADLPLDRAGTVDGFVLSTGDHVRADVIIGADGATSGVAESAGLVDHARVLWGFAARTYVDASVVEPHILLWTPKRGQGFPGYGWVFPSENGRANVGLGVGVLADRASGRRAVRDLDAFLAHADAVGVIPSQHPRRTLGGWLKMGLSGTTPARGRVLLVGDAAGLVNPLQGEGIAQAIDSGRAAADAIIAGVDGAAARYRAHLDAVYTSYVAPTATAERVLLPRPRIIAALTRTITAPVVGRALAATWSIYWNDLADGAEPSVGAVLASGARRVGAAAVARGDTSRAIRASLREPLESAE